MALAIFGERQSGNDVRSANVTAVVTIANILKSSLGPQGLDKMLVDDIGEVTISNDGATILKQLEVQHPAAKVLVELSDLQDKEVGDGTTSVVLLAAELLRLAHQLVEEDVHPTAIIAGYKLAMKECVRYINRFLTCDIEAMGRTMIMNVARTTLNSKFLGAEDVYFADMCVKAMDSVKTITERGDIKFPVSAVSILKTHGKSSRESSLVEGYALKVGRGCQGMPTYIKDAKIALLNFNLRQHRMQLGVSILVTDPAELEKIRQREKDIVREKLQKIIESGANVIITSEGIDDMCLKYCVEAGAIALRRVSAKDIRRIAKITGASVCLTMATLEGEEYFDPAWLGRCGEVYEDRVGDWDHIFFKGCTGSRAATIILRGANEFMLDEVERSLHDALCAVSRVMESRTVCAGGGCVEAALSVYLEDFARTLGSREQLAVAAFSDALLVIPKTLAINAALDANEIVAKLRAAHVRWQSANKETAIPIRSNTAGSIKANEETPAPGATNAANAQQTSQKTTYPMYGLDLLNGTIRDSIAEGCVEAAISKVKSIRFATEAAVTILRIDDLIKIAPEPERKE